MNDSQTLLEEIFSQFSKLKSNFNLEDLSSKLDSLEKQTQSSDFWSNEQKAKSTMQQIAGLKHRINSFSSFSSKLQHLQELSSLAQLSSDPSVSTELSQEISKLNSAWNKLKLNICLDRPHDNSAAIFSIHSGQGGVEAMDWAAMLKRMYLKYFESANFKTELIEESLGEEAGIKSVTYIVKGNYAYGYLKGESGTHRLVRLSPFNADNLRQTSFAAVEVLPSLEESSLETLKDEDLVWQFYRSGGKGGQNVNKVSTAVRLTHKPTGIVVTSQAQRQQQQNRKIAKSILESKLWQLQTLKNQKQKQAIKGDYQVAGWGTQIRSYVLHPYHLVKDLRTNHQTSDTQAVLSGTLEKFIQAYIFSQSASLSQIS